MKQRTIIDRLFGRNGMQELTDLKYPDLLRLFHEYFHTQRVLLRLFLVLELSVVGILGLILLLLIR